MLRFKDKKLPYECDGAVKTSYSTDLIRDIYNTLWTFEKCKSTFCPLMEKDAFNGKFGGETMNSFSTSYNRAKKTKKLKMKFLSIFK